MSLELSRSPVVRAWTENNGLSREPVTGLGLALVLDPDDMCDLIRHFLTSTDLGPDDPRETLLAELSHLGIVPGWNPSGRRIGPVQAPAVSRRTYDLQVGYAPTGPHPRGGGSL